MSKLILFAFACGLFALTACSGAAFSGSSSTTPATVSAAPATCAAGSVYTVQYGCLPQSSCPAGEALYNNTCVSINPTTTVTPTPTPTPTSSTPTSCASGQVYSSQYGCLEQLTCPQGSAWYNGQCIVLEVVVVSRCQDWCPAGFTNTPYGCLPKVPGCPPCTGYYHGICYWGVDAD